MIKRWWHNFLDSFTYLNDRDIKWLELGINKSFYKAIQNLPKSIPDLVECTNLAFLAGMTIVLFSILMVRLYFAKTAVESAEFASAGFIVFVGMIVFLKSQFRRLKILLILLSISQISSASPKALATQNTRATTQTKPTVAKAFSAAPATIPVATNKTEVARITAIARRIFRIWKNLWAKV